MDQMDLIAIRRERRRRKLKRKKQIFFSMGLVIICTSILMCLFLSLNAGDLEGKGSNMKENRGHGENFLLGKLDDNKDTDKKTIVIDAGHGGFDGGTVGPKTGCYEKDINLQITKKLKKELEKAGYNIILTRKKEDAIGNTKEADMEERKQIINDAKADLFISIHQNYNEDSSAIKGAQILYFDEESKTFAENMQKSFNEHLNTKLNTIQSNYIVLEGCKQPSIIVECGFLSNEEDERLLQTDEYQKEIVKVIVDVVKKEC